MEEEVGDDDVQDDDAEEDEDEEENLAEDDLDDTLEGLEAEEEEARFVDLSTLSVPALLLHSLDGGVDVQSS